MERILADVKPPPHAVPVWNAEQQHQEAAFNTANAAAQPAVYFSPDVYQDLAQLYHTLQERLAASAPPPVDPKKGGALSLLATCLHMQLSDGAWTAALFAKILWVCFVLTLHAIAQTHHLASSASYTKG